MLSCESSYTGYNVAYLTSGETFNSVRHGNSRYKCRQWFSGAIIYYLQLLVQVREGGNLRLFVQVREDGNIEAKSMQGKKFVF